MMKMEQYQKFGNKEIVLIQKQKMIIIKIAIYWLKQIMKIKKISLMLSQLKKTN